MSLGDFMADSGTFHHLASFSQHRRLAHYFIAQTST